MLGSARVFCLGPQSLNKNCVLCTLQEFTGLFWRSAWILASLRCAHVPNTSHSWKVIDRAPLFDGRCFSYNLL